MGAAGRASETQSLATSEVSGAPGLKQSDTLPLQSMKTAMDKSQPEVFESNVAVKSQVSDGLATSNLNFKTAEDNTKSSMFKSAEPRQQTADAAATTQQSKINQQISQSSELLRK